MRKRKRKQKPPFISAGYGVTEMWPTRGEKVYMSKYPYYTFRIMGWPRGLIVERIIVVSS